MEEFTQVPFGLQLIDGAPTGTRTPDPLIKSQPLYQLSYRRTKNNHLHFSKPESVLLTIRRGGCVAENVPCAT